MKATFYALMALIAISLSACTTINPMQPTATVYPATQPVVVEAAPVVVEEPTQVATVTPPVEALIEPMFCESDGVRVELASEDQLAEALRTATCPEPQPLMTQVDEKQLTCMAMAIYHEARGESERGQAAVGYVVHNRVVHPSFGDTICDVVYKRSRKGCQFSWVCDGKSDVAHDMNSYKKARDIALRVILQRIPNPVGKAVYFDGYVHGSKRKPGQMQIGAHRFYADYGSRNKRPKGRG